MNWHALITLVVFSFLGGMVGRFAAEWAFGRYFSEEDEDPVLRLHRLAPIDDEDYEDYEVIEDDEFQVSVTLDTAATLAKINELCDLLESLVRKEEPSCS